MWRCARLINCLLQTCARFKLSSVHFGSVRLYQSAIFIDRFDHRLQETDMHNNKFIKGLLAASVAAMFGAIPAHAQTAANPKATVMPPVTGEPNDHTSPGADKRPDGKAKPMTSTMKPGVNPPVTGEPNDHTSAGAMDRPAPKAKTKGPKAKRAGVKPPVTGEANDHSSPGGATEAAKAAKEAKPAGM
jgi:hypothetical protein